MAVCEKCRHEAEYTMKGLEIQTLFLRDMDGEKRVQAVGGYREFSVCQDCAEDQLQNDSHIGKEVLIKMGIFLLLAVAGAILSVVLKSYELYYRVFGFSVLFCGVLGSYGTLDHFLKQKKEAMAGSKEEQLKRAAWMAAVSCAPKKWKESDLTYIPLDERTMRMKNGDLMIEYKLLPEIAVKVYNMIHS